MTHLAQVEPRNIFSLLSLNFRNETFSLCIEFHRIDTVIGILTVTSCKAAASGIALFKSKRNLPASELRLIPDQPGLVTAMIAVAGSACESAFLLVYMQEMQIEPAVAKIRIRIRIAFARNLLRMAGIAECVPRRIVG